MHGQKLLGRTYVYNIECRPINGYIFDRTYTSTQIYLQCPIRTNRPTASATMSQLEAIMKPSLLILRYNHLVCRGVVTTDVTIG